MADMVGAEPVERDDSRGKEESLGSTQDTSEIDIGVDQTALIERIAAALDIPPNDFLQPGGPHSGKARVLTENAEALKIFAAIENPDARQRGLAYLRWIANQGGS